MWQIVLLPSRAVCTAARCIRSYALQGRALAFEECVVSTKKIARTKNFVLALALSVLLKLEALLNNAETHLRPVTAQATV